MKTTATENSPMQDLDHLLNGEQRDKGYRLSWWKQYRRNIESFDNATLLFKNGQRIYAWYSPPTLGEVDDKIEENERSES